MGYRPSRALCARDRSPFDGVQNGLRQRTTNGQRAETREERDGAETEGVWRKIANVRVEGERGSLKITTRIVSRTFGVAPRTSRKSHTVRRGYRAVTLKGQYKGKLVVGGGRAIITRARGESARGKDGRKTFSGIPHTERNRARLHFSTFRLFAENAVSPPADHGAFLEILNGGPFPLFFSAPGFRQSLAARPQKTLRRSRRSVPPATQKRQRSTDGVYGTKSRGLCELWTIEIGSFERHRFPHPLH